MNEDGSFKISNLISFIMPVGYPDRDYKNISENLSKFSELKDSELIIVIDSPTPNSHWNLEEFNNMHHKVKIIRKHVGNPGGARNEGLKHASGNWIVFIDSDDQINFTAFHGMIIEAIGAGAQLALGNFITESTNASLESHHIPENDIQTKESIARNPGIWRMGFAHEVIEGITFPEIKMAEDQVFLALLGFWNLRIYKFAEVVYVYRQNVSGQLTGSNSAVRDILLALSRMFDIFVKSEYTSAESKFIAIMMSNQLITAFKRLRVRGFIFGILIFLRLIVNLDTVRLAPLLLQTFLLEVWRKVVNVNLTEGKL